VARVYLSSSYRDLKRERATVAAALRAKGHDVTAMEGYPFSAECPVERCRSDVREADVLVGLFARRYGYVPPGESISITEIEYRSAVDAGTPIVCLRLDDAAEWPRRWTDAGSSRASLAALRRELCARHQAGFFSDAPSLVTALERAYESR
jgi:hypothetical protein